MIVLIATKNKPIVEKLHPKSEFVHSTENTCYLKIHGKTFKTLLTKVKDAGFNPYALFTW